ncbi:S41 family peptidase [Sphingomicrobium sediminis]|uniref:S41 family peptidase n=1 Tax=Sphingomicrobium sediminis TaxID=2950949 RepID=A0A9X2J3C5_9SPHN|nr:S41 family peptidase [Sphingomicrobium sediminis]MCM8557156.1 S41 family peptidase [Sphingomicrobium sediminis]
MSEHDPKEVRSEALLRLADMLEQLYVFPKIGHEYADHLRDLASGSQDAALSDQAFAEAITEKLQAIHADGHLRIEVEPSGAAFAEGPSGPPPAAPPSGLREVRNLAPGVAYLRLDSLWGDPPTMGRLATLVESGEAARGLVIDLRQNRGGGLAEMDFLFPHLFTETQALLVMEVRRTIYDSEGGPFRAGPNLRRVDSSPELVRLQHEVHPATQPALADARLFVLISEDTGSAAEHFALALKRTGRATLVGSATKGAAHFGGLIPLGNGFRAFVPAGRTFDPDTGESWEGTGVKPDIVVEPEKALEHVLGALALDD